MINSSLIKLTINVHDPNSDAEELERFTRYLVQELNDVDGVEQAKLVSDLNVPEGSKSFGAFVIGLLQTEVSLEGAKTVFALLNDCLGSKSIELEVEADGKKLKIKASNRKDLEAAIREAQEFISS